MVVEELKDRGGFHASARLVALQSGPGEDPLWAIQVAPWRGRFFPTLMLPGALDGTKWQGVPEHLSLNFVSECPPGLLAAALHRWGRRRRVWISCKDVTSGRPLHKVS